MKFTHAWLKEHLQTEVDLDAIVDALTDLGLEVESVHNPAAALRPFTIGKVLDAAPHPNADKLRVCRVLTQAGERQIICGAPNARKGIMVVVAQPGDYVPGIDKTIGIGTIRGVESQGMMCSEREMSLGEDHDGIIELPSGAVGQRLTEWLATQAPEKLDAVIEVAITPNRPDALGVRGIARDLAARGLGLLKPAPAASVKGAYPNPITITIEPDTQQGGCLAFATRHIRDVKNGASPQWLQDRLHAIGLRPVSALVDITNFFTYDRNRPLHVFDADKIRGALRIHRTKGGESLIGLDEKQYTFTAGQVVISDDSGVISIGGIMGGLATGCTVRTRSVLLEAALWDPVQIALSGRALQIDSDARHRNERGIDPAFNMEGLDLATAMIMRLCGGTPSEIALAGQPPKARRSYKFDPARVAALVGMEIPEAEQRKSLQSLGFTLRGPTAEAPSWRPDIQGEADLIEEVVRIASLTRLKSTPLPRRTSGITAPILSRAQKHERIARRAVAACGYNECLTYTFIASKAAELFGGTKGATTLENPISTDMRHMRSDLLPGLLQAVARNQARGTANLALFEIGATFHGTHPRDQHPQIAGLRIGNTQAKDAHKQSRPVDVFDVKADAEAVLQALGAPSKMQLRRDGEGWWHPLRHGRLCLGPKRVLGTFGALHPRILRAFDVRGPAVAFTLWPANLPEGRKGVLARPALKLHDLQAIERDFAFVVDASTEAIDVTAAAHAADRALIADVRVFDVFEGEKAEKQMGVGKKSIAIAVRLQPVVRSLKDAEIEAVSAKIIAKVGKAVGAQLRR
ncbi:MAG: phenylalanine--tRNA ligase subunit beta [Rhodobacteraceae bacterium]|nr:phenylalanine--tRNA ligase subunit beta [Paracoccaceae bacterium]